MSKSKNLWKLIFLLIPFVFTACCAFEPEQNLTDLSITEAKLAVSNNTVSPFLMQATVTNIAKKPECRKQKTKASANKLRLQVFYRENESATWQKVSIQSIRGQVSSLVAIEIPELRGEEAFSTGESFRIKIAGQYRFNYTVDYENVVQEVNEENNSKDASNEGNLDIITLAEGTGGFQSYEQGETVVIEYLGASIVNL